MALVAAVPYLGRRGRRRAGSRRAHLGPDHMAAPGRGGVRPGRRCRAWSPAPGTSLARPPAAAALLAIGLHRLCYGVFTLMTLLLYRNTFADGGGLFPGGILGLGQVRGRRGRRHAARGRRSRPPVVRRIGKQRWIPLLLVGGGVAQLALVLAFAPAAVVLAGCCWASWPRAVKICVDSTLQETVEDDFRGRVFSVYDTLFNVTFVAALLVGGLHRCRRRASPIAGAGEVAGGYLLAAVAYSRITRRH